MKTIRVLIVAAAILISLGQASAWAGGSGAAYSGNCNDHNTATNGAIQLNVSSSLTTAGGVTSGSQSASWSSSQVLDAKVYVGGQLVRHIVAPSGSYTQHVTGSNDCITDITILVASGSVPTPAPPLPVATPPPAATIVPGTVAPSTGLKPTPTFAVRPSSSEPTQTQPLSATTTQVGRVAAKLTATDSNPDTARFIATVALAAVITALIVVSILILVLTRRATKKRLQV